jgi:hypothetical protein
VLLSMAGHLQKCASGIEVGHNRREDGGFAERLQCDALGCWKTSSQESRIQRETFQGWWLELHPGLEHAGKSRVACYRQFTWVGVRVGTKYRLIPLQFDRPSFFRPARNCKCSSLVQGCPAHIITCLLITPAPAPRACPRACR